MFPTLIQGAHMHIHIKNRETRLPDFHTHTHTLMFAKKWPDSSYTGVHKISLEIPPHIRGCSLRDFSPMPREGNCEICIRYRLPVCPVFYCAKMPKKRGSHHHRAVIISRVLVAWRGGKYSPLKQPLGNELRATFSCTVQPGIVTSS